MSEAPLDRSERTERTEGEAGGNRRTRSMLGRVVGRVRAACHSVGHYLKSGLGSVVGSHGRSETEFTPSPERDVADFSDEPAQYALVSDGADTSGESDGTTVVASEEETGAGADGPRRGNDEGDPEQLPARSGAAAAGPDRDRPELEAELDGDELTLVSPDDADARITSDVWQDVER